MFSLGQIAYEERNFEKRWNGFTRRRKKVTRGRLTGSPSFTGEVRASRRIVEQPRCSFRRRRVRRIPTLGEC
jgi:hypothetical protein